MGSKSSNTLLTVVFFYACHHAIARQHYFLKKKQVQNLCTVHVKCDFCSYKVKLGQSWQQRHIILQKCNQISLKQEEESQATQVSAGQRGDLWGAVLIRQ